MWQINVDRETIAEIDVKKYTTDEPPKKNRRNVGGSKYLHGGVTLRLGLEKSGVYFVLVKK